MSKKFKSIVAMLLAMVMVLAMAMPTFAAGNGANSTKVTVEFLIHNSATVTTTAPATKTVQVEYTDGMTIKDAIVKAGEIIDADASVTPHANVQWGFDSYSDPNGYYITSIYGITSKFIDANYSDEKGKSWYEGNDWMIYQTSGEKLNVTENTYGNAQALTLYASNVAADTSKTIHVVYQKTFSEW